MRLLFDQNLSSRLVRALADLYPDSEHVRDVGLASADDVEVWSTRIVAFLADPEAAFLALA